MLALNCVFCVLLARSALACDNDMAAFLAGIPLPSQLNIGTSTAAYQIEGAWNTDGRGPSIWDDFTHRYPERIRDGSNGDIAANSYEMYKEDIKLMKNIGMQYYRFSISWSRILPNGELASLNPAGVEYYNRVINHLLENGIEPMVTMYHLDLPQAFVPFGGLTNSIVVDYFEAYANLLFSLYGDRVKYWITFNEPTAFCITGYGDHGARAPGLTANGIGEYLCMHNVIKSHAKAYHVYRKKYYKKQRGKVSITVDCPFAFPNPVSNSTSAENDELVDRLLQFKFGYVMHPILKGDYPPVMRRRIDTNSRCECRAFSRLPRFTADEIAEIKGTADFIALNYYSARMVSEYNDDNIVKDNISVPSFLHDLHLQFDVKPEWKQAATMMLYSVPAGLGGILRWIKNEYNNPYIVITENGWSDNGTLQDTGRIDYIRDHLTEVVKAMHDGCNVIAYTVWSIIDNFEWNSGFTEKFGLHHVDFASEGRKRTPKMSAEFMRNVNLYRTVPRCGNSSTTR